MYNLFLLPVSLPSVISENLTISSNSLIWGIPENFEVKKNTIFLDFENSYKEKKNKLSNIKVKKVKHITEIIKYLPETSLSFITFEKYKKMFPALYESLYKLIRSYNLFISKKKSILIISPIYGGSYPVSCYCYKELKSRNFKVEFLDCSKWKNIFLHLENDFSHKLYKNRISGEFTRFLSKYIVNYIYDKNYDLILVLAQAPILETEVEIIKKDIPIGFWFVEDFRTLKYWKRIANSYDVFFTIQKGEFFEELKKIGANYYYVPTAAFLPVHKPLNLSYEEKKLYHSQISFVGAPYPNRINVFSQLLKYDIKIWGEGWNLYPQFSGYLGNNGKYIKPSEYVKVFNASDVNINLHSSLYYPTISPLNDFVNPRLFEIAATKSFQLVDFRAPIPELYDEGEIEIFKSIDELKEKIEYYLNNREERLKIAEKSYLRTITEHTYWHRLKEIFTILILTKFELLSKVTKEKFYSQYYPEIKIESKRYTLKEKKAILLKTIKENILAKSSLNDTDYLVLMLNELVKIYE